MRKGATFRHRVERVAVAHGRTSTTVRRDVLATEEPLEIRVVVAGRVQQVAVTMRTPGSDFELAAGFLFGERLITRGRDIAAVRYCTNAEGDGAQRYNTVNVHLSPGVEWDPAALERNFYTTSSCGVCGKASIEAVRGPTCERVSSGLRVAADQLVRLPASLREAQPVFDRTGGLHAAALFTADGSMLRLREDVGRHNAMDKLVGAALLADEVPLSDRICLASGRLSFELVQKAARAGIPVLAGVSAPSSLAVELAGEAGITLIGFLRDQRFNIYTGGERVSTDAALQQVGKPA